MARFRADDLEGLHALHSEAFRAENPFETWAASVKQNREAYESFLTRARYAGTRLDGDRACIALASPGAPRPSILRLVREDGSWRFAE